MRHVFDGRAGQFVDSSGQPVRLVTKWSLACDVEELVTHGFDRIQRLKGIPDLQLLHAGHPSTGRFQGELRINRNWLPVVLTLAEGTTHVNLVEPDEAIQAIHHAVGN